MDFSYTHMLSQDFDSSSRVWIYQCSRAFTTDEMVQLEGMLPQFATNWKSHGTPVKGYANIFFNQFIIIMADETATGVSGCSTDSSVHLVKQIEQHFSVDMFNRKTLAFIIDDEIQLVPLSNFFDAIETGVINLETSYFNNLVSTKREFENNWITPVKDSWLASKLRTSKNIIY